MIEGDEIHAVLDAYGLELVDSHPALDVCDGVVEEVYNRGVPEEQREDVREVLQD